MSINKNDISTGIVNEFLSAVDIITTQKIDKSGFDRTIEATIVKIEDETTGEYLVRYQDSMFSAFAVDTNIQFANKASVYILIPGNDFRKKKTILGTVKSLGANYIPVVSDKDSFEINGANCVGKSDYKISLSSYYHNDNKDRMEKILYQINSENLKEDKVNLIGLKQQDLQLALATSEAFMVTMNVQTSIPIEQRYQGEYGLMFNLIFKDVADENKTVMRHYVFSNNQMVGNPYRFISKTKQTKAFSIDGANFSHIDSIIAFSTNFIKSTSNSVGVTDNIFFTDLQITGATKLTTEELSGYKLTILTPQGSYFTKKNEAEEKLTLRAQVRLKGKVAASDNSQIKYYWFRENATIDASSVKYLSFGGPGWECLNKYNVIDNTKLEYVPGTYEYIVNKKDYPGSQSKIKCCAVYNEETIIHNTILINNLTSSIEIELKSSEGTQFYYDSGSTVLSCTIKDKGETVQGNFKYYWGKTDSSGYFSTIDTQGANTYTVLIKDIVDFASYSCTVYEAKDGKEADVFYGSAEIKILNTLSSPPKSTVIINGGTKVFKYTAAGVSPCANSRPNPEALNPLTFTIYDEERKEITEKCSKIIWTLPRNNTMLSFPCVTDESEKENLTIKDNEYLYTGKSLAYQIKDRYNMDYVNNTVLLTIECRDLKLVTQTQFTFTKEGEIGTNGTDFYCKIVLNAQPNTTVPAYPALINGNINFSSVNSGKWFKAELWEGNVKIDDNQLTTEWSILANNYGLKVADESYVSCTKDGIFSTKTNSWKFEEGGAGIAQVKVTYDKKDYYATIPILNIKTQNNATINLVDKTGFTSVMYQTDGTKPAYADNYPFEINVTNIDNPKFEWGSSSKVYKNKTWVQQSLLKEKSSEDVAANKRKFMPASVYDGQCLTNGVWCKVKNNSNSEVASIWIPVHMYLNRYGQELLNGWNGNSIEINKDGGIIYSPQVGAGKKESDNSFTGVLLGKVQEHDDDKSTELVGLLGYSNGVRSIFLDAYTGKAEFGKKNGGQIILDPTSDKAEIKSGSYVESKGKEGMLIDFTTPQIHFGNGNFNVDKDGKLTAKSAYIEGNGTFSGTITANTNSYLQGKVNVELEKVNSNSVVLSAAGVQGNVNGETGPWAIYSLGNFGVTTSGHMHAKDATIHGHIDAKSGTIGNWEIQNNRLQTADSKVYLGTDGFKLRDNFEVTSSGNLTAKNATLKNVNAEDGLIGSFKLDSNYIQSADGKVGMGLTSDWAFWAGHTSSGTKFRVSQDGDLFASNVSISGGSISIGGNTFNSNGAFLSLNSGNVSVDSKGLGTYVGDIVANKITANNAEISKLYTTDAEVVNLITSKITADYINAKYAGTTTLSAGNITSTYSLAVGGTTSSAPVYMDKDGIKGTFIGTAKPKAALQSANTNNFGAKDNYTLDKLIRVKAVDGNTYWVLGMS